MRGFIALIVLLSGGLAAMATLHCPMGAVPDHRTDATDAAHPHASSTGHHADTPDAPVPPHQDGTCSLMLACGSAVLGAAAMPHVIVPGGSSAPGPARSITSADVFHAHETPPPRRTV